MNISTEIVLELLYYNPDTGAFTWRHRAMEWFTSEGQCKRWNTRHAGKEAGSVDPKPTGYPRMAIRVLGKRHIAARLAFLAMGEVMPEQVDHANGDSLDNRWANLLSSSPADNHKNQSMSRANTSGVTGVCWNKRDNKWRAQGRLDGKLHYLGRFDDLDEAAAVVAMFHAANGFSARHGQALSAYQEAHP